MATQLNRRYHVFPNLLLGASVDIGNFRKFVRTVIEQHDLAALIRTASYISIF